MRLHPVVALVLAVGPACVSAQVGYAHGSDHCYYFAAPTGWAMDNNSGSAQGVPMVFYPLGSSWSSAPVAMYTRPAASTAEGTSETKRIGHQVAEVVTMYRSGGEAVSPKRMQSVTSRAGAKGELWSFSGYSNGGTELVAYFPARQTVNYFVLQLPKGEALPPAKAALMQLADSYREGNDCKPCTGAPQCAGTR